MYTISYPSGTIRQDGVVVDQGQSMDAYVGWLKAGNGPEPLVDAPAPPRIAVSAWQIRKALNATGLRSSVESTVAASDNQELKDGWNHSPSFYSDNPLTLSMGAALGKAPEEMHQLFEFAESL